MRTPINIISCWDGKRYLTSDLSFKESLRVWFRPEAPEVIKALENAINEYNDKMEFLESKLEKK